MGVIPRCDVAFLSLTRLHATRSPSCATVGGSSVGERCCTIESVNWPSVITAGLSGLIGSLLAIFATPWLQHHFWKCQRRAEVKLRTVEIVNALTSQFIQQWIATGHANAAYQSTLEWYEKFSAAEADVKALFGAETYKVFKNLENRVDPALGTDIANPILNVNAFVQATDAAVKALYREII